MLPVSGVRALRIGAALGDLLLRHHAGAPIDKALIFLDSASALIAVLAISSGGLGFLQTRQIKKNQIEPGPDPCADLGYQGRPAPGRDGIRPLFLGQLLAAGPHLSGVHGRTDRYPLEKCLEALKIQCLKLDKALPSDDRQWLETARELADVAAAMARERYQLDYSDVSFNSVGETCIDHDLEVLVYTWSASLKSFDHQLDEIEQAPSPQCSISIPWAALSATRDCNEPPRQC
jgi:hypothetical protein